MDASQSSQTATIEPDSPGDLIPVLMRLPDVRPPSRGKSKRNPVATTSSPDVYESAVAAAATGVSEAASREINQPEKLPDTGSSSESTTPESRSPEPDTRTTDKPINFEVLGREEALAPSAESGIDTAVAEANGTTDPATDDDSAPVAAASSPATTSNRRQRQRRATAEPQPSWWKSQGRVLAILFVVALALTIFVAKSRKSNVPDTAKEDEAPSDVEITSSQVSADSLDAVSPETKPVPVSNPSIPPLASTEADTDPTMDDLERSLDNVANGEQPTENELGASEVDDPPTDDLPPYEETDPSKFRFPPNAALEPRTSIR